MVYLLLFSFFLCGEAGIYTLSDNGLFRLLSLGMKIYHSYHFLYLWYMVHLKQMLFICQLTILFVWGCKKNYDYEMLCNLNNRSVTTDDKYKDPNANKPNMQVYILRELVTGADCNCIVSGMVKYLESGKTSTLVDYGKRQCDQWVAITICYDEDCEDSRVQCYKFNLECSSEYW